MALRVLGDEKALLGVKLSLVYMWPGDSAGIEDYCAPSLKSGAILHMSEFCTSQCKTLALDRCFFSSGGHGLFLVDNIATLQKCLIMKGQLQTNETCKIGVTD